MNFREQVDKILDEYFFKPYGISQTYGASDNTVNAATKAIDELAATQRKGFCIRTANNIKAKLSTNVGQVTPEPK